MKFFKRFFIWAIPAALLLLPCNETWAAFGEDTEKPKPKFSQEKGDWIAELVPRGKSTPIQIRLHTTNGTMTSLAAKNFPADNSPEVDRKTFRSDFFIAQIQTALPGGEVTLSAASDYFSTATELWAPEKSGSRTWSSMGAKNIGQEARIKTLTVNVQDGGPMDADGVADGRIQFIFGPMDSFWGYAIGTLFIRFFGVFLVLAVLEVGMIVSGRIFQALDKNDASNGKPVPASKPDRPEIQAEGPAEVSPDVAAAIAVALGLESKSKGGTVRTFTPMIRSMATATPQSQPVPVPQQPKPASTPAAPAPPQASTGDDAVMTAPMPGVVTNLMVAVGGQVIQGETVVILEAMKMENDIVAEKSGTVTEVHVQKGQQVSTGDPMLVIS